MSGKAKASRRLVGIAMVASAAILALGAVLVFQQIIGVAEESRSLVGGVLGFTAVTDVLAGLYFIVSDPS